MIRFLAGSTLLFMGMMVGLAGAVTLVGLPIGLALAGWGLQVMLGPGERGRA
jgi:hypothetical protein